MCFSSILFSNEDVSFRKPDGQRLVVFLKTVKREVGCTEIFSSRYCLSDNKKLEG